MSGGMMNFRTAVVASMGWSATLVMVLLVAACRGPAADPTATATGTGTGTSAGAVRVTLDQFGVGSTYRPGEITALRLELFVPPDSGLDDATPVWVQWEIPTADGDVGGYGRPLTLTRGVAALVWLYAPLPPLAADDSVWSARVFEFYDGRRGREIGGLRFQPGDARSQQTPIDASMIAVVGQRDMGLRQYSPALALSGARRPPSAHEATRIVGIPRPGDLPDRWDGFKGFEALAWSDASPQDLPEEQASALREYIRRGGHLVISLPADTNPWGLGAAGQTYFDDLLPRQAPEKVDDVPLETLLPVLSKAQGAKAQFTMSIRVFGEVGDEQREVEAPYEPLIALPDGRVVAVQRTFGHGRITLLGIDVASGRLAAVPLSNDVVGLPQADVFWKRVLGRRIDSPSAGELAALDDAKRLNAQVVERNIASGDLIAGQIGLTGPASKGLLLAVFVFIIYWLVAGPLGFGLLKQYGRAHHAWLAFAATAALFTGIAWAGAAAVRTRSVEVKHVTFLDHIARPADSPHGPNDPQLQRAVSWMSIFLPRYGTTGVFIDSAERQRDLLYPWQPPGRIVQPFPNPDHFLVDVGSGPASFEQYQRQANPSAFELPSRSTDTQLYAHWLGGVDPDDWGGLIRAVEGEIAVELDPTVAHRREIGLRGTLVHDLPGTLTDVTFIWVRAQRNAPGRYETVDGNEAQWVSRLDSGQLPNLGYMTALGSWPAGTEVSLADQFSDRPTDRLARNITGRYIDPYDDRSEMGGTVMIRETDRRLFMEMLSIFNVLDPPTYIKPPGDFVGAESSLAAYRQMGRELDLSPWFTRPCLIVIGHLHDSPLPIPLLVDDERPSTTGRTIVRWIFPLELDDAIAFPRTQGEDEPAGPDMAMTTPTAQEHPDAAAP